MRLRRLALPWTWAKLFCSTLALIVNGIQLSECSDETGAPLEGWEAVHYDMARAVAREGRQLRRHVGALE